MRLLKDCISDRVSLSEQTLDKISAEFEEVELKKGEYFLRSNSICKKMAFIESGFIRMYQIADGKEITFWIANSGKFITSLSSFIFQTSNHWNIQAITDCKICVINRERHFKLCANESKWLEFDNLILAHSFAMLENSMFAQLHTTAQERYEDLLEKEPELIKNVPLQFIASMLGIAPESLSRLRKKIAQMNT